MLLMLIVWVGFWSITCMTGEAKRNAPSSELIYSLAVLCSLLLGSLRLWYALIPMFMLVTGAVLDPKTRALSRQGGSIWTMWALLVLALSYVHRRIAGTHQLLDMVNLSPATGGGIVGVVLIFLGFSVVFATVSERDQFGNSIAGCFGVLTVCWGLSLLEWFWIQRTVLALVAGMRLAPPFW